MSRSLRNQQCRQCESTTLKEAFGGARSGLCDQRQQHGKQGRQRESMTGKRDRLRGSCTSATQLLGKISAKGSASSALIRRDRLGGLCFGISFRARPTCGTWGCPCNRWLAAGLLLACKERSRIGGVVWADVEKELSSECVPIRAVTHPFNRSI